MRTAIAVRLSASGLADAIGTAFFRLLAFPGFVLTEMLWPVVVRPEMRPVMLNRFFVLFYRFTIRPLAATRSMMTFAVIMIGGIFAMQLAALGVQDVLEDWIARFAALVLAPLLVCLMVLFRGYAPEMAALVAGLARGEDRTWQAFGTTIWHQVACPQWLAAMVAALTLCAVQLLTLILSAPVLTAFQSLLFPSVRPMDLAGAVRPDVMAVALMVSLVTVGGTVAWSSFSLSRTDTVREDGALAVLRMIVPFCLLFGIMEGWAWRIVLT